MSSQSEKAKKATLDEAARATAAPAKAVSHTLVRDRAIVPNDFVTLADDATAPTSGKVIVSLARWQKEGDALKSLTVGVKIPNTADISQIWAQIKDRPLIVLEFPGFADGRAYSQARLLRDAQGYRDEIRAVGPAVVRDQIAGMARCGINAFELRADQKPEECLKGFADFSLAYQPAADSQPLIFRRRA